jgi:hypothetical protein
MTRLIGRIAVGKILPGCACAQDPEDPVENLAPVARRSALPIAPTSRLGQQRIDDRPLGVGKIHGDFPMQGAGDSREFAEIGTGSVASTPNSVSGF